MTIESQCETGTIKDLALRRLAGSRDALSAPLTIGHKRNFQEWPASLYHKFVILVCTAIFKTVNLRWHSVLVLCIFYCLGIHPQPSVRGPAVSLRDEDAGRAAPLMKMTACRLLGA